MKSEPDAPFDWSAVSLTELTAELQRRGWRALPKDYVAALVQIGRSCETGWFPTLGELPDA